jgi:hypothetical protein
MNNNVDLNIDNYSIGELKSFFKLQKNYSNSELNKKVSEMETVVSSSEETEYKYKTLYFINQAKQILTKKEVEVEVEIEGKTQYNPYNSKSQNSNLYNLNANNNTTQIPLKNPPPVPNSYVGQILNPGSSSHQSMETTFIESNSSIKYDRLIKNYIINTLYRDDYFGTSSNNCSFTFPTTIKDVISMSLSALQYQNVMFSISNNNHTNKIYILENTTNYEGVVIMPEGNYSYLEFPIVMENAINDQILGSSIPPRFSVSINPNTRFTTISNSTYTFTMSIITSNPKKLGINCNDNDYDFKFTIGENDAKKQINPEQAFNSLGYMMGFRKLEYFNEMSYTSESLYLSEKYKYVYFIVNDYAGNQTKNTAGMFPKLKYDEDILALIPISSDVFTTTFSDGSTYIYRTRNYNGPVDISKISIKLVNPMGQLADIHDTDYTFCLQLETIFDMTKKYTYKPG